jgi:ATP-dependent DNA helicase RecG
LVTLNEAIDNLHFPKSLDHLGKARKRIAFDELFLISLRAKIGCQEIEKASAPAININEKLIKEYVSSLPFSLTNDQRKAAWQIVKDLDQGTPMNRLLNGDVGSGKTVVAAIAAYAVIKSGYRVVLMAPTEVLASQHYQTFCGLFSNLDISVGLLTSSIKKLVVNPKSEILNPKQIQNMENSKFPNNPVKADIVIGTHALLQKSINLENVGLIIVDEQHRFGVRQRALLKDKTDNKIKPHFLSMTATPIPRTLHLSLFGDLDISIISEKPKNRKEIKTRFVEPENRSKAYEFIRNQIKNGRQAFVICPLIEDVDDSSLMSSSDLIRGSSNNNSRFQIKSGMTTQGELFDQDRKSVMKEYEKLRKEVFPEYKVAMLHGKMKPKEKDEILGQFAAGKSDVLVSTSVIEVGINVPNATVMMIEDAERFGLAQIHQFRGRVGRAEHQSFCFLFSNTKNPKAFQRLKSLEAVSDGFRLAEIDLENRGPGEIFGILQSGQLELKMASFSDRILIEEAAEAADEILKLSRDLSKFPQLAKKLAEFEMNKHME